MYINPEMARALYQARAEDLQRRPNTVRARWFRLMPRITFRRKAPVVRTRTPSIVSATVRSPKSGCQATASQRWEAFAAPGQT
jgi:hypothetical protein